ncbi:MAG: linear amide C-N hydrolase [Deltaproteobacteria bacterium]|nr:linear amide C-N hydrolase [Deltaproteobacteria bacterium]
MTMLPGTNRAADRFVRASFYINAIPKTDNTRQAVASVFGVIRGVSVPLGISTPGQPNISSTLWRTVADLDFRKGLPVKRFELVGGKTYSGNAAAQFKSAEPFKFMPASGD